MKSSQHIADMSKLFAAFTFSSPLLQGLQQYKHSVVYKLTDHYYYYSY